MMYRIVIFPSKSIVEYSHSPLEDLDLIKKKQFNIVLLISIFRYFYGNAFTYMPLDITDDKSTLIHEMV